MIEDSTQHLLAFTGGVLLFLGLQHYLGSYITTYAWAFVVGGIGLMIWSRKLK